MDEQTVPSQLAVDTHIQRSATNKLRSLPAKQASFVELLGCLSVARLPEGPHALGAIIVGYQGDGGLTYVARIRNGFVPASRRQVFEKLRPLARIECPLVNLPGTRQTRWGEALTVEKMKKCIWVNPELVAQIEFLGWT